MNTPLLITESDGDSQQEEVDEFNNLQTTITDGSPTNEDRNTRTKRYGFGPIEPDCLQILNKPVYFLIVQCIVIFNFGFAATGLNNTMLTSIEKRYGFKSTQIALFTMTQHFVAGVVAIFVCYIGHKHRPLTIAIGCFISSIGFLTISVPQYVVPLYQAGVAMDTDFCRANTTSTVSKYCNAESTNIDDDINVLPIFLLGYALLGIGVTPLYSLGAAHIDQITTRKQSSLYFAVFAVIGFLGPAIGFVAGNPILNIYVDIKQPLQSNLKPTNRNWVGAWWISFVIGSIITFIPILPMLGFASEFPNTWRVIEAKKKHADTIRKDKDLKHNLKDFVPSFKKLLRNKPFMCLILSVAIESLTISGFSVFLPKYLETQFYLTASSAASYVGFAILPGSVLGILIGGYLCRRFSFNGRKLLIFNLVALCASTVFMLGLLMGCDSRDIVGATSRYYNSSSAELSIDDQCNQNCQCSMKFYKPVCSVLDQRTFYSPCHAGCSSQHFADGVYANCTCLPQDTKIKMVDGRCMPECSQLPYFMILIFFNLFFTFVTNVPKAQAYFRLIPEGQGSLGQGLQQTVVRFLGFIPASPFFGSLIDRSCELWHVDECTGQTTSCLEYDNHKFKYYLMALAFLTKIISIFFMILSIKFYRLPKKNGTGEDNQENVELM